MREPILDTSLLTPDHPCKLWGVVPLPPPRTYIRCPTDPQIRSNHKSGRSGASLPLGKHEIRDSPSVRRIQFDGVPRFVTLWPGFMSNDSDTRGYDLH